MTRKSWPFINESVFVALNYVTWPMNINPHCPDDGSVELKRYSVDFVSQ